MLQAGVLSGDVRESVFEVFGVFGISASPFSLWVEQIGHTSGGIDDVFNCLEWFSIFSMELHQENELAIADEIGDLAEFGGQFLPKFSFLIVDGLSHDGSFQAGVLILRVMIHFAAWTDLTGKDFPFGG